MEVLSNLLANSKDSSSISLEYSNLEDISDLLPLLQQFSRLENLNLSNNNISQLPYDLSALNALRSLDISNNELCVEDVVDALQTLPGLQVLYISLETQAEADLIQAKLPHLLYLNGEPIVISTPRPCENPENSSFTDYELTEVAGLYDKVRELWRDAGSDYDNNLVDEFDIKIKAILDDLSASTKDRDSVQIKGNILMAKYSMYKFVIDKAVEFLHCTEHRAGEILNQGIEVIDTTIGEVLGLFNYLPTPITDRKREPAVDKETAEVLEAAELLEEELVAQKQQNATLKKELDELRIEMEAVQEENKKYLDMIIKQSKSNAENALSNTSFTYNPRSTTFIRSQSQLQVSSNGQGRVLTLKQLKDTIEEIYTSKIKYDLKCTEGKMPRETMEQYMWTFLNQKYGLKNLITDWAAGIKNALLKYSKDDNDIAVFLKILNNECDEEYRFVQTQVKETVAELLKVDYI